MPIRKELKCEALGIGKDKAGFVPLMAVGATLFAAEAPRGAARERPMH
jgi:hypothetical protein